MVNLHTKTQTENAMFIFIYLKHFYTNHLLSANHVAFVFGGNFCQLKLYHGLPVKCRCHTVNASLVPVAYFDEVLRANIFTTMRVKN